MGTTPYRWNQLILDKLYIATLDTMDNIASTAMTLTNPTTPTPGSAPGTDNRGATKLLLHEISKVVEPYLQQLQPLFDPLVQFEQQLLQDASIHQLVDEVQHLGSSSMTRINELITNTVTASERILTDLSDTLNIDEISSDINRFLQQFAPTEEEIARKKAIDDIGIPSPSILQKLLPKLSFGGGVEDTTDAVLPAEDASVAPGQFTDSILSSDDYEGDGGSGKGREEVRISKKEFVYLKNKFRQPIGKPDSSSDSTPIAAPAASSTFTITETSVQATSNAADTDDTNKPISGPLSVDPASSTPNDRSPPVLNLQSPLSTPSPVTDGTSNLSPAPPLLESKLTPRQRAIQARLSTLTASLRHTTPSSATHYRNPYSSDLEDVVESVTAKNTQTFSGRY